MQSFQHWMYFIVWIYLILFISSAIQGHLVYFQVFLMMKSVAVLACDFIFSWSYPPQESWAHTGGRNISIEGFIAEPHGVYKVGTVLSCYFLDSDCADLGPESRVWDPPPSVCFPTQCLGQKLDSCWEFLGWKVGTCSPCYTNVHLFPAPCYEQSPDPRKCIWSKCAVELHRKLFDQLNI